MGIARTLFPNQSSILTTNQIIIVRHKFLSKCHRTQKLPLVIVGVWPFFICANTGILCCVQLSVRVRKYNLEFARMATITTFISHVLPRLIAWFAGCPKTVFTSLPWLRKKSLARRDVDELLQTVLNSRARHIVGLRYHISVFKKNNRIFVWIEVHCKCFKNLF